MSPTLKGSLTMTAGITILSVDSLLIRLIETSHWTLLFWRGVFSAIVILAVLFYRSPKDTLQKVKSPGATLLLGAFAFSLSTVCFVTSIVYTQVASTLVIINLSPMISALLAFIFLKESINLQTAIAIAVAIGGVWLVFDGQFDSRAQFGNLMALGTALALAAYFVILRHTKSLNASLYLVYGGIFTALLSLFANPDIFSLSYADWLYTLLLCAFVVPISFVLISTGPKYLPAAHANLFMLLEAILGPLFVWWVLGEVPNDNVILGGSVIVITLVVFTFFSTKERDISRQKT